ncbi:MAG: hypothetical protein ACI9WU_002605 [Myxococcota bacterium]
MNSEFALVEEAFQHGVRDGANAHLQGGSVFDEVGHAVADQSLCLADHRWRVLQKRPVGADECIDAVQRDHGASQRSGHLLVDFGDDHSRRAGRGDRRIDGGAYGAAAVLVRGQELENRDIKRNLPGGEQAGDIGQKHR